jgi:GH24 family phage-related lysozyme (muramidase)
MLLMGHGFNQVPAQLPLWVHAAGVVEPGLVRRRAGELARWNS